MQGSVKLTASTTAMSSLSRLGKARSSREGLVEAASPEQNLATRKHVAEKYDGQHSRIQSVSRTQTTASFARAPNEPIQHTGTDMSLLDPSMSWQKRDEIPQPRSRPLPNPLPAGALHSTPPRVLSPPSTFTDSNEPSLAQGSRFGRYRRSLSLKSSSKATSTRSESGRKLTKRRSAVPSSSDNRAQDKDPRTPQDATVIRQDSTSSAGHTAESSVILLTPVEPVTCEAFYGSTSCSEISLLRFISEPPAPAPEPEPEPEGLELEAKTSLSNLSSFVPSTSSSGADTVRRKTAPDPIPACKSSVSGAVASPPPRSSSLDLSSSSPPPPRLRPRPPLVRIRSSSTGSLRDSMVSIGEVHVAERVALSPVEPTVLGAVDTAPKSAPPRAAPPPLHLDSPRQGFDASLESSTETNSAGRFKRLLRAMSYGGTKRDIAGEQGSEKKTLKKRLSKPTMKKSSSTTHVAALQESVPPVPASPVPLPRTPSQPSQNLIPKKIRSLSVNQGSPSSSSLQAALGQTPAESRLTSPVVAQLAQLPSSPTLDQPQTPTAILHALEATNAQNQGSLLDTPLRRKGSLALIEYEARRRCRQTLVDIQDDVVFHEVLQTLKQSDTAWVWSHASQVKAVSVASGVAWEKSVRAWFVTRELVKSERSYGGYLERGVQVLSMCSNDVSNDVSTDSGLFMTSRKSTRQARKSLSGADASVPASRVKATRRASTHPDQLQSLLPSDSMTPHRAASTPSADRLSRLLTVSLDLSARFAHDPSPFGVATAFTSMESRLSTEFAGWAKVVGSFVGGTSRRSGSFSSPSTSSDRLDLADIIIMPTQRALRYALLFHELASEITTPSAHLQVQRALDAAKRIAAECDRHQTSDLGLGGRSRPNSNGGKKRS